MRALLLLGLGLLVGCQAPPAAPPAPTPTAAQVRQRAQQVLLDDPIFDAWVRCGVVQTNLLTDQSDEPAAVIAQAAMALCVSAETDLIVRHATTLGPHFAVNVRASMRDQLVAHVLQRRAARAPRLDPRLPRT